VIVPLAEFIEWSILQIGGAMLPWRESVIPKESILMINGIHDLFGDPQPIEELWQKWEQPKIWRLAFGHVSVLFAPGLTGRVRRCCRHD
jgi:hypothetical protein